MYVRVTLSLLALLGAMLAMPSAAAQQSTFVGPLISYISADLQRVIVDDLGAGATRSFAVTSYVGGVWSPDGNRLAVVDLDNRLVVIDIVSGAITPIGQLPSSDGFPVGIDWLNTGEIAAPNGRQLLAINATTGAYRILHQHTDSTYAGVDAAPDGRHVVTVECADEDEGFCSTYIRRADGTLLTGIGEGASWDWSPDSTRLAFSGIGVDITAFNVDSGQATTVYRTAAQHNVAGIVWRPDGTRITALDYGDFNPSTGQVFNTNPDACCAYEPIAVGPAMIPLSYSPDGTLLAGIAADSEYTTVVYRVGSGPINLPGGGGGGGQFAPVVPNQTPPPPPPSGGIAGVTRLAGPSRVQTAIAISADQWADSSAAHVVIATADAFPDSQTAAPLAAGSGPLLLSGRDQLHPDTATELQRVLPSGRTVYLVGGTAALSELVADAIRQLGYVVIRLAGSGRDITSVAIASQVTNSPQRIFYVDGGTFPPGILAGAAAGNDKTAVVVSGQAGAAYVSDHPDAEVIQVGDTAIAVEADRVIRGSSASDLSIEMTVEMLYERTGTIALASAEQFPDGLAGAAHAANAGIPILLTPGESLAADVDEFLEFNEVNNVVVYGGPVAISDSAAAAAID